MYTKMDLLILLKKLTYLPPRETKRLILPNLETILNCLNENDRIITGGFAFYKLCQGILLLMQDRIIFIKDTESEEIFIRNIASFNKSTSNNATCTITIGDAGSHSFEFSCLSKDIADLIIRKLKDELTTEEIEEIITNNDNKPLNIPEHDKVLTDALYLGFFGIHRFTTGYIGIGFLQIILLFYPILLLVWWLIDVYSLLTGTFKAVDGLPLSNYTIKSKKLLAIPVIYFIVYWLLRCMRIFIMH